MKVIKEKLMKYNKLKPLKAGTSFSFFSFFSFVFWIESVPYIALENYICIFLVFVLLSLQEAYILFNF